MCLIRLTVFDPYPPSAGALWTPSEMFVQYVNV